MTDKACGGEANTLDTIARHTETLVVFGSLSPRTAQNEAGGIATHMLETHLRAIAARRVRVILVSPLRDDIPDWVNAEWWPIRPNTDTALMLSLAGEILKADLGTTDRSSSAARAAPTGCSPISMAVRMGRSRTRHGVPASPA